MSNQKVFLVNNTGKFGALLASFVGTLVLFLIELTNNFLFSCPDRVPQTSWKEACSYLVFTTDAIFFITVLLAVAYMSDKLLRAFWPEGICDHWRFVELTKNLSVGVLGVSLAIIISSFILFYIHYRQLVAQFI